MQCAKNLFTDNSLSQGLSICIKHLASHVAWQARSQISVMQCIEVCLGFCVSACMTATACTEARKKDISISLSRLCLLVCQSFTVYHVNVACVPLCRVSGVWHSITINSLGQACSHITFIIGSGFRTSMHIALLDV